jgi:hypothetical protein
MHRCARSDDFARRRHFFKRTSPALRATARSGIASMDDSCTGARPYNVNQLDSAIAHLEQVLKFDGANSLFSKTYWRARVEHALATPGLMPSQHARLQRLLHRIETS